MDELLAHFEAVSLEELDARAALLRRVDNKYALSLDAFAALLERLRDSHDVLEIDRRRVFAYSSTYFDTPDLRCFRDHVEDRSPRFKVRTRFYEDSDRCEFEVKLKDADGETDKRQLDYPPEDRDIVTREARDFLGEALQQTGIDPPGELTRTLTTSFGRATLAHRDGDDRLTCDTDVQLVAPDGETAAMREDLVLVETKSAEGRSPADHALRKLGHDPISLSKYRVGIDLVGGGDADGPQPGSELFEHRRRP